MSRIQLSQLARKTASSLTPLLQLAQLPSAPTLLRGSRERQWFGSKENLTRDFAAKQN